jgi:hypothetical protein
MKLAYPSLDLFNFRDWTVDHGVAMMRLVSYLPYGLCGIGRVKEIQVVLNIAFVAIYICYPIYMYDTYMHIQIETMDV